MKEFKMFWNYYKRKNGEIVIDQSEMEAMIAQAYESGYNSGLVEGMKAGKPVVTSKAEAVETTKPLPKEMTTNCAPSNNTCSEDVTLDAEQVMPEPEEVPEFDAFAVPDGMDLNDELPM